jgi:hypothetical protein
MPSEGAFAPSIAGSAVLFCSPGLLSRQFHHRVGMNALIARQDGSKTTAGRALERPQPEYTGLMHRVSMAGRTRLYPARDASASSDVGLPRFDASGDVSKIDGVMASRWLPPVRR